MTTFTNDWGHDYNARVLAQAEIGDVIREIVHGGTNDMQVVWVGANRRGLLTQADNVFKFFDYTGFVNDAFIGGQWTTESVLRQIGIDMAAEAAPVVADQWR